MSSRKSMRIDQPSSEFLEEWKEWIFSLQKKIVEGLQEFDDKGKIYSSLLTVFFYIFTLEFYERKWQRKDGNGGGIACILENGSTFEKGGVNVTHLRIPLNKGIYKTMSDQNHMKSIKEEDIDKYDMFACGLSLVIHPINPFVPTTHANYRVIVIINKEDNEIEDWWFGGGSDLTPTYLNVSDAIHFHTVLKNSWDKHDLEFYPKFKDVWDKYFVIEYRKEARGVGGIFYENLNDRSYKELFEFAKSCGESFNESYCPIVKRRMHIKYTKEEEEFRKWRRSRYAEFNLVYDRGTKFGLFTPNAEIENILMSLPLSCSWKFDYQPKDKREKAIMHVLKNPVDWVNHPLAQMSRKLSIISKITFSYPLIMMSEKDIKDYWEKVQKIPKE